MRPAPRWLRRSQRATPLGGIRNGAQHAGAGESENKPRTAPLESVANEHRRNGEQSDGGQSVHGHREWSTLRVAPRADATALTPAGTALPRSCSYPLPAGIVVSTLHLPRDASLDARRAAPPRPRHRTRRNLGAGARAGTAAARPHLPSVARSPPTRGGESRRCYGSQRVSGA